ncbi:unnamed protein product [Linum trigynum]|uniref:Uncharacterized protein n=1 Tax=Linum trigynum TaxID=586398 RepID=A0AAV2GBJ5_9ROSI
MFGIQRRLEKATRRCRLILETGEKVLLPGFGSGLGLHDRETLVFFQAGMKAALLDLVPWWKMALGQCDYFMLSMSLIVDYSRKLIIVEHIELVWS